MAILDRAVEVRSSARTALSRMQTGRFGSGRMQRGLGWPEPERSDPSPGGLGWPSTPGAEQPGPPDPEPSELAEDDDDLAGDHPVSRETESDGAPLEEPPAEEMPGSATLPQQRWADEPTPLAQSAAHSLLVREGRRLGPDLTRPLRTRILAVANQKGGVGKTTSTVNMAAALAQQGLRVLVVDVDPQGNASTALAVDHPRGAASTYDVLTDGRPLAEVVQACPGVPGLTVAPATIDLAGAEIELVSMVAREGRLRRAIQALPGVGDGEERIDFVLIDCPPSLGLLTLNALVAADEVMIPIQAEYYALEGLGQLIETVEMVRAHLNPTLRVSTILLTMFDSRTRLAAGVAEEVRAHFPEQVLRTAIPRSVRISEAPSYGQTVMTYDPGSAGALSYLEAARELAAASRRPVPAATQGVPA